MEIARNVYRLHLWSLLIVFKIGISVHNREIASYCPQCETGKPVSATWSRIDFDTWPSHEFCGFTLLPSITNDTKMDIWVVKTSFDPSKTLKLPDVPRAIYCGNSRFCQYMILKPIKKNI